MATTTFQINNDLFSGFRRFRQRITARGLWFGLILLAALVAFELFNFATTEFALQSLFGAHDVLGLTTWAKILAIAFCGIDFAGLSRLFTPETGRKEPREIWLLTGAWLLGAGMNAVMTWWAVTSALAANPALGNELVTRAEILRVGPVFIAALVWFTRVLIIGTFAFAGDHIFSTAGRHGGVVESHARPVGNRPAPPSAYPPAQPRAVPKPSERRSLPERSTPLASSAYARHEEPESSRYGAGRSFFGSGAGSYREPAAAATMTPPAASAPVAQPARPAAGPRPSAFDGPSARTGSMPSQASGSGSASFRASTTRTISPEPERPAPPSQPAARSRSAAPEPATMELEYVDLD